MLKRTPRTVKILLGLAVLVLLAVGLYFIPPIHAKLAWRLDNLRTSIIYFFHPPQNVTFHPGGQSFPTPTPESVHSHLHPHSDDHTRSDRQPTLTPTITSTPPPGLGHLAKCPLRGPDARYNYCGPANLAMALEYWGWKGDAGSLLEIRDQIAAVVKPGVDDPSLNFVERGNTDVNVMPYEMVDFVNEKTSLQGPIPLRRRPRPGQAPDRSRFPGHHREGHLRAAPARITPFSGAVITPLQPVMTTTTQEFIWQDSYLPTPKSCRQE